MNYKIERLRYGFSAFILSIVAGLCFVLVGLLFIFETPVDKNWVKTSGKVVDVNTSSGSSGALYAPIIGYTVENIEYKVTSASGSSFYPKMGESQDVYYNPDNPNQARIQDPLWTKFILILFSVAGLLILIFSPIAYIKTVRRDQKIAQLIKSGKKITGVIIEIKSKIQFGQGSQYRIVAAAATADGIVRNFISDGLSNVTGFTMIDINKKPIPIDVYIDPQNAENYYVDISEIPGLTAEKITELVASTIDKLKTGQPQSQSAEKI